MFSLRKFGSILRGASTPFQVLAACVLGALIGFAPGFLRAPALLVGLFLLLVILNANLGLALMIAGVAKLASLALSGVEFSAGRFLLDGPTRPLFVKLINAPVFAFCGLEWYVGAGGLLLGLLFGIGAGLLLNGVLGGFRRAMVKAEDDSILYQRTHRNPLLRFVSWLLIGPRHKNESYRDLLTKKVGMPVRIPGLIVAAALVAAIWFGAGKLTEPLLRSALKDGLQAANGATVDVGGVELDLAQNRLAVRDLAMADEKELDRDLFRAARLECDVSGTDLLRKRLKLDRVVARDAVHGAPRSTPGVRNAPVTEPSPPPESSDPDDKTLDEWIASAEKWKARLQQTKEWLDKLKRPPSTAAEDEPTLRDRLEKEAEANGWRNVAATHLIEGAPLFQVGELLVEGMRSEKLDGQLIDLRIENLSTNPALVDGAPRITLKTRDQSEIVRLGIDVGLGSEARVPAQSFLDVKCRGLPTADVARAFESKSGSKPLEGGTIDAGFRLTWAAGQVAHFDNPLDVIVRDTTVTLPKVGSAKVKELSIPLFLRGPLDNPRVKLDAQKLADNLAAAGADALAQHVEDEAKKRIDAAESKAKGKLEDEAKKALEGFDPFKKKKKEKKGGGE